MVKKQRSFWMDDEDYKKLIEKAKQEYLGKGFLERYLESIARNVVLILKGARGGFRIVKD
jgi:hypothetical protein